MRCRMKWRNFLNSVVVLLLILLVIGVTVIRLQPNQSCRLANSREFLRAICHSYTQQIIGGKICPILCESSWRLRGCHGHLAGKRVLLFERDTSKPIDEATSQLVNPHLTSLVVKTSQKTVQYGLGKMEARLSWIEQTRKIITAAVTQVFLRQPDTEELMRDFWDQSLVGDETVPPAVLKNSVWALTEQREYILLKHLSEGSSVPPLLGSCGPLYAVVDAPPPPDLRVGALALRSHPVRSWGTRALLAVEIVRLLRKLELQVQPPLLVCDMKADNFGMARDGSLRLLDLDTVFVEEDIFSRECYNDNECSLFACRGRCVDGQCQRQPGFSLLQSACQQIFSPASINSWQGLLSSSPSSVTPAVNAALQSCLNPSPETNVRTSYVEMERALDNALLMINHKINVIM